MGTKRLDASYQYGTKRLDASYHIGTKCLDASYHIGTKRLDTSYHMGTKCLDVSYHMGTGPVVLIWALLLHPSLPMSPRDRLSIAAAIIRCLLSVSMLTETVVAADEWRSWSST